MKFYFYLVTIAGILALCGTVSTAKNTQNYPVYFSENLSLDSDLADPVKRNDREGFERQLQGKWDYGFKIISDDKSKKVSILSDCTTYFKLKDPSVQTDKPYEQSACQAMVLNCEAIRKALKFKPAKQSYLSDFKLDEDFTRVAPPEMAMIISNDDVRKMKKAKSWFVMARFKSVDQRNEETSVFKDASGGIQVVKLFARGDYNDDGVEDVMLYVSNGVEGGSYRSSNVYILTRLAGSKNYTLLEMLRPI